MKLFVINASPKAKQSITLQHIRYFEKSHPEHEFEIIHIGKKISAYEQQPDLIHEVSKKIRQSDALIWCFPVYYALVPYQLKRFIELLFKHYGRDAFKGTYATGFTTSINFFDHTAHNYVQGISEDLGFSYIDSFSAHMNDFFDTGQRKKMDTFFSWFTRIISQKLAVPKKYNYQPRWPISYNPDFSRIKENVPLASKTLVLTDEQDGDQNLAGMTQMFAHISGQTIITKNIRDVEMKNGCLGCCTCGYDNTCVQNDGYTRFYNEHLKSADTIIIAGSIKDHYLSAIWKKFFDRSFFNGHVPVLKGKRLGFIISGPLTQLQNLRETLEALSQGWHMKSIDIVTDEYASSDEITRQITAFAQKLQIAEQTGLEFGPRFYQVGGGKIFRDFIFNMTGVFQADHQYYKKMGMYDTFPQRQIRNRMQDAVFSLFMSAKPVRKKIHQRFISSMVAPYKKVMARKE